MSVEGFINYYNTLGKKIAKPYYYLLKGFEAWLAEQGKTLDNFTPNDAEMYYHIVAKDSPRSANLFLSAIRKYAEWRVRGATTDEEFVKEERRLWGLKGIRMQKVPREIKKEALNEEELKKLLITTIPNPPLFVATVVHFYFGWRPYEGAVDITRARMDWENNYMVIRTAKVGNERILVWADEIAPFVAYWYNFARTKLVNIKRPEEWYTKAIKPVGKRLGLQVTARTARKTFETQMRKRGVEQWAINFILGHTTTIPDVYTDWGELREYLRNIMEDKHYLLPILDEVMDEWMERRKSRKSLMVASS